MAKVPITVTEHLHEQGRWTNCSRLFLHDERRTGSDQVIRIRGLRTPLFPYQGFGVFVMTEMELFQGGGFNADDMGLGKVCLYMWLLHNGYLLQG